MSSRMRAILKGWGYALWDDFDNLRLVAEYFPQFLERYRSIQRGVVRADIARCMYLYIHGGFYFDTDYKILTEIGDDILANACRAPHIPRLFGGCLFIATGQRRHGIGATPQLLGGFSR